MQWLERIKGMNFSYYQIFDKMTCYDFNSKQDSDMLSYRITYEYHECFCLISPSQGSGWKTENESSFHFQQIHIDLTFLGTIQIMQRFILASSVACLPFVKSKHLFSLRVIQGKNIQIRLIWKQHNQLPRSIENR